MSFSTNAETAQCEEARKKARNRLRRGLRRSLDSQGFSVTAAGITPTEGFSKEAIRRLHLGAVEHARERSRPGLERHEPRLLAHIASGDELDPSAIAPQLVEVSRDSEDELLFRWVRLHWSIPVSAGYGRRLRFVVKDRANDKLIGIIGLADPVFSQGARDGVIGWTHEDRKTRLRHVMDAFVLGAVPPYSELRCGKLVAMLAASDEVREAFAKRYRNRSAVISRRRDPGQLAMLTTTSALGRSSIYNRLRFEGSTIYQRAGYTTGYGDFQFMNGIYDRLRDYAHEYLTPTERRQEWGRGFRNRRELVRKVLIDLGLGTRWQQHGVRREVFLVPFADNSESFLRGECARLRCYHRPVNTLARHFRERWLAPRMRNYDGWKSFDAATYALWGPES